MVSAKRHLEPKPADRKLKKSGTFIPCPVDEEEEMFQRGIFIFNISKMTEYILATPEITVEPVQINQLSIGSSKVNEAHLPTVDISKPIIMAELSPGRYDVIDGNHRLEKARRAGLDHILGYRLEPKQHMQFLTTEKGYLAYIAYWNEKLKELASR